MGVSVRHSPSENVAQLAAFTASTRKRQRKETLSFRMTSPIEAVDIGVEKQLQAWTTQNAGMKAGQKSYHRPAGVLLPRLNCGLRG